MGRTGQGRRSRRRFQVLRTFRAPIAQRVTPSTTVRNTAIYPLEGGAWDGLSGFDGGITATEGEGALLANNLSEVEEMDTFDGENSIGDVGLGDDESKKPQIHHRSI